MFTGIIEEVGKVEKIARSGSITKLRISCSFANEVKPGDSIAVNGACLTVVSADKKTVEFELTEETMQRTAFKKVTTGDAVNLERAMKADGRFDGHIVTGHIDTTGIIRKIERKGETAELFVEIPDEYLVYCAEKGSIAVDGISLTIVSVEEKSFSVALIPFTLEHTNLKFKKPQDLVNIEVDLLARYVYRIFSKEKNKDKTFKDFLERRW